jgi:hypothetical protein
LEVEDGVRTTALEHLPDGFEIIRLERGAFFCDPEA